MPMWRCPHCGTPQAETARCWVCRRSSTACGTCRNFRRSVAAQLGYCGLDRGRQPLAGDEIRSCWEAWPHGAQATEIVPLTIRPAAATADGVPHREFIEVHGRAGDPATTSVPEEAAGEVPHAAASGAPPRPSPEPGWSLWAELEG
jgi:hypothetical protein